MVAVAQPVERQIVALDVAGSSPVGHPISPRPAPTRDFLVAAPARLKGRFETFAIRLGKPRPKRYFLLSMATSKAKKTTRPAASKAGAATSTKSTSTKSTSTKVSPEEKLAASTIKLLDQASQALKKTLTTGASESSKAREAAKKKAHSLLGKAHEILGKGLDEGFNVASKALKRLP
jgi:hypothetical protein